MAQKIVLPVCIYRLSVLHYNIIYNFNHTHCLMSSVYSEKLSNDDHIL